MHHHNQYEYRLYLILNETPTRLSDFHKQPLYLILFNDNTDTQDVYKLNDPKMDEN